MTVESFYLRLVRKTIFLLLLISVAQPLVAQIDRVFKVPFPRQYIEMDQIIRDLPLLDSLQVSKIFTTLDSASQLTTNELSKRYYAYSKLNYRNIVESNRRNADGKNQHEAAIAQLIKEYTEMLTELDEDNYPVICALIHIQLGDFKNYNGVNYPSAFTDYLKGDELFKRIPISEYSNYDRQISQYFIGLSFFEFGDYEKAIEIAEEIEVQYPQKTMVSVYNVTLLGICHIRLGNYRAAMESFNWLIKHNQIYENQISWQGITLGNIGTVYYTQGNYPEAIRYYEEAIPKTIAGNAADNTTLFAANLITIYLSRGDYPHAKYYGDLALKSLLNYPAQVSISNFLSNGVTVYAALSQYFRGIGNTKMALAYQDSLFNFKERLAKKTDLNLMYKAEIDIEAQQTKKENIIKQSLDKKNRAVEVGVIVILIILTGGLLIILKQKETLDRVNKKEQLTNEQRFETTLSDALDQFQDFTHAINEKNVQISSANDKIGQRDRTIRRLKGRNPLDRYFENSDEETVKKLHGSVLLTESDWQIFIYDYDKVHPGYLTRLKRKYPSFTPAEIRIMILSRLDLKIKEIALILAITADATRLSRRRLKKKLHIKDDQVLQQILLEIWDKGTISHGLLL